MSKKLDSWYAIQTDNEKNRRAAFAEEFKGIRIANRLSINEMAAKLSVSEEMVMRIELGCVSPDVPNLRKRLDELSKRKSLIIA